MRLIVQEIDDAVVEGKRRMWKSLVCCQKVADCQQFAWDAAVRTFKKMLLMLQLMEVTRQIEFFSDKGQINLCLEIQNKNEKEAANTPQAMKGK